MKMITLMLDFFKFLCVAIAGFMVGYWFYKFHKNEDISVIEYKPFKDAENTLYPELNFCLLNLPLNDELKNISRGLTRRMYFDYLLGKIPANDTYEKISYEEVTLNFFDYLSSISIAWKDKSIPAVTCKVESVCPYLSFSNTYNGFLDGGKAFTKCFGIATNKMYSYNISSIKIFIENSFEKTLDKGTITILLLNYPGQKFRNLLFFRLWEDIKERTKSNNININSFEVVKRRSKRNQRCIPHWNNYDDVIVRQQIEKVGCRAPYHLSNNQFPICRKHEDLKTFQNMDSKLADNPIPPCHEMSHVSYKHNKEEKNQTIPHVFLSYPKYIKEISQEQKIDHHALIGNIGGYIGLFLGMLSS